MATLRTPEERFSHLPDFPYPPQYAEVSGLRMHYVDVGPSGGLSSAAATILCLHGEPTWSFLYSKMIHIFSRPNRVVGPDMIGFGRSDKPSDRKDYTFAAHRDWMVGFLDALALEHITLVCQDWGGLIGLRIAAEMPDRFDRLVIMNTGLPTGDEPPSEGFKRWREFAANSDDLPVGFVMQRTLVDADQLDPAVIAAYEAPFPDASYKAGAMQFPLLVPISPEDPGSDSMRAARRVLGKWMKPALVMFSDSDPITRGGDRFFRKLIPSAQEQDEVVIRGASHFLQEDRGEEIAEQIVSFVDRTPL